MADDVNLQAGVEELAAYLPEEIIDRYRRTTFTSPSSLERSVQSFLIDGTAEFTINAYAEFLDEGTRFITAQPFITPVLDDDNDMIEEILTIAFEKDIDEAIEDAISQGPGRIT